MAELYVFEIKPGHVPNTTYVTTKGLKVAFIDGKCYIPATSQVTISALQEDASTEGCPFRQSELTPTIDSSDLDPKTHIKKQALDELVAQITDDKVLAAVKAAIAKVMPRDVGDTPQMLTPVKPTAMIQPQPVSAMEALLQQVAAANPPATELPTE